MIQTNQSVRIVIGGMIEMKGENKKIDSKKATIKYINKKGIQDIKCETIEELGSVHFALVITTKDGNSFHFVQSVEINPHVKDVDVIYFDETGNGEYVYTTEGLFKPAPFNRD